MEKRPFDGEGASMQTSGERASQTEGTAMTKAQMPECAWHVPGNRNEARGADMSKG